MIEAHENAFLAFGGLPHEVLYDNLRTVVNGYGRGRHRFQAGFLDFARHCGFQPRLCAPYRAQTKGKSLPSGLTRGWSGSSVICGRASGFRFPAGPAQEGLVVDRETANSAVKRWLREAANARLRGTAGAIPAERMVSARLQLQRSRRLMAVARFARCGPHQSQRRSSAGNIRCRCTTCLPQACGERPAAPTPGRAVKRAAVQRRSPSLLRDRAERRR